MKPLLFFILTLTLVSLPDLASAADLVPCSGTECSACNFAQMGNSVFKWLIGVLFVVFGFVAAMGGFGLVTSGGNPEAKSAAKQKLINAVIGILIMFAAWLLVDTILRGLVTGGEGKINGTYWYSIECGSQTKTNGAKVTAAKHNLTTFTAPQVTTAATTINSTPVNQSIVNAAAKAGMTEPTDLNTFLALMYVESDSCTKTVSTEADVYGCGQISVDTARSMDPSLTSKTDEEVIDLLQTDTDLNLYLSAKYFDHLTKLTGSTDDALALYNAGPVAMQPSAICADTAQWQCAEDKAYQETTNYVANVKAIAASTTLKPPVLPPQNCTVVVSPSIHTLNVSESRTLTMDCAIGDGLSYVWTNNGVSLGQTSKSISFSGTELGTYYLSAKAISEAGETEAGMMLSVVPEYVAPGGDYATGWYQGDPGHGTWYPFGTKNEIVVDPGGANAPFTHIPACAGTLSGPSSQCYHGFENFADGFTFGGNKVMSVRMRGAETSYVDGVILSSGDGGDLGSRPGLSMSISTTPADFTVADGCLNTEDMIVTANNQEAGESFADDSNYDYCLIRPGGYYYINVMIPSAGPNEQFYLKQGENMMPDEEYRVKFPGGGESGGAACSGISNDGYSLLVIPRVPPEGTLGFSNTFLNPGTPLDSRVLAGKINSYEFKNDKTLSGGVTGWPAGRFTMAPGNLGTGFKDISISECAGDFRVYDQATNTGVKSECMKMNATTGSLYWSKDGRDLNIGPSCILESGKNYYLNVRSHDNNSDSGFVISNYLI